MPPSKCPAVEMLTRFVMGQSADDESEVIEQHLLGCEECLVRTREVRQSDTLMDAVRQSRPAIAEPSENAALSGVIERLRGQFASASDPSEMSREDTRDDQLSASGDQDILSLLGPAESADELGRLGEFRVLKLLGVGGMGVVFLAEDTQLQRLVALKTLKPEFAARQDAAGRFLREARAAAAIKHEHVVTIYQVGEAVVERPSGAVSIPFLAQELLEGESLDDRLRRESPLPVVDVLRIGREIAEGLAAAHAKGLIHRDIKPANVWLERSRLESSRHAPRDDSRGGIEAASSSDVIGAIDASSTFGFHHAERDGYVEGDARVKLLDFGLARTSELESQITSSGMIVGTPSYMAPEQANGEAQDARADLFSLGVILYRMTTGQLPFPGRKMMEVLKSLATVTPAAPRSLNPAVPRELSDLIERLLAKDRDARPASAREVAKALGEIGRVSGTALAAGFSHEETDLTTPVASAIPLTGNTIGRTPPRSPNYRATALAALSAVLLLAAVLFVQLRGGTLKIEADEGIDVSVVKEQVTIRDTVSGKTYKVSVGENSMRPGQYEIVLRDPDSGLKVSTDRVEIQRGNSTPLRITLQPDLASKTKTTGAGAKAVPKTGDLRSGDVARSETGHNKTGHNKRNLAMTLPAMSFSALVRTPATLDGVQSWTLETVGHRGGISDAKFSPKGTWLATADSHGCIRVWEPSRGKLVKILIGSECLPSMLAWSPDELRLASVESSSGMMRIWDVEQGRIIKQVEGLKKDLIRGVSWSADGKHLVTNFDQETTVWNTQSWGVVDRDDSIGSWAALSPDGLRLAGISHQGVLQVFDFETLKLQASALPVAKDGRGMSHRRLAWSPKGDLIAVSSSSERTAWVVNASNGEIVWTKTELAINARTSELGWSPDGSQVAIVANADAILLLDGTTGELRTTWKVPQLAQYSVGALRGIVWSPDGTVVCATAFNPETIGLLDPKTGAVRRTIEGNLNRDVMSLAWFGDESTLVADIPGGGTMTRFWKVPTLEVVPSAHDGLGDRAPGGQAGLNGSHFRTQSTPTSLFEKQASLDPVPNGSGGVAVSWSGDGKTVAVSGYVGKIWLYEYPSGKLLKSFENSIKYGLPIALSPDTKTIISAGTEEIGLYRTENGELIKRVASKNGPYDLGLAYSPDGQLLAVGTQRGFVQIWKSDLSAVVHEFRAHTAGARSLLWSHDGRQLVTTSHNNSAVGEFDDLARDPTIRFWNPHTGESLGTILVHRFNDHLAVTPAGHYRVSPVEFERDLVYIVQTAAGQLTLTPDEFEHRFGWKNDPETVRLDRQP